MSLAALVIVLLACVAIFAVGARFVLIPQRATVDYGVAVDDVRALTAIKGVRDIVSGIVLIVVWAAAGRTALGWAVLAASLTPIGDAVIVQRSGGKLATVLGVHVLTALLLVAAGVTLVLA